MTPLSSYPGLDPGLAGLLRQMYGGGTPRSVVGQSVADARRSLLPMTRLPKEDVQAVRDEVIAGPDGAIPLRVYRPTPGRDLLPVIAFFHGGGWVVGDLDVYDGLCRSLAIRTGAVVVSVDYRLAPEHAFPAGLDDAYAATAWLGDHATELGGDPQSLVVAGDSAGGNLAAVVCQLARERGGPTIAHQLLLYPGLDADSERPSAIEHADAPLLDRATSEWYWRHYRPDHAQRTDPRTSPLRAPDLAGLPPATILTAELDLHRDDAEHYAERLREAGVPVQLHRAPGMTHGFLYFTALVPAAEAALVAVSHQLRTALAGGALATSQHVASIDKDPMASTTPTTAPTTEDRPELLATLYRNMALARRAEKTIAKWVGDRTFEGWWHPGTGQEASGAGAMAAAGPQDYVCYYPRGIVWCASRGLPLVEMLGDLAGRTIGNSNGKGGGVPHWASEDLRLMGLGGTLGSVPHLASGIALASVLKKEDAVTIAAFGEGSSARGTFHESMLQASVWKLPILWYCENNDWAVSTAFGDQSPTEHVSDRASAYGMRGEIVDGQDAVAVYEATREALAWVRAGNGPMILEAKVTRYEGHYGGDAQNYRPADSLDGYRDPLDVLRPQLADGVAERLEAEAQNDIDAAVETVLRAPIPGRETIFEDIYA